MHDVERFQHQHIFGTDRETSGERRTRWVIALTAVMMVIEIAAGVMFGSMALLADGIHMATHTFALGITVFAYTFARRHAGDRRYTFGTGKATALGGFGSAVSLAVVAVIVLGESVARLADPAAIDFDEAIAVAVVGLLVNLVSALLLRDHEHEDGHGHEHEHEHEGGHGHEDAHAHEHHDHNLRGAYLHVLADALTSVLAIGALVAGKYLGWSWLDAVSGIVGALVIARWSLGLLRSTGAVLLDAEVPEARRLEIRAIIERESETRVADLHVWRVGPQHLAAIVSVVTHSERTPEDFKRDLARFSDLAHVTVEVQRCCAERIAQG